MKTKNSFYHEKIPVNSMENFADTVLYPLMREQDKEAFQKMVEKLRREKYLLDICDVEGSSPELELELEAVRKNLIDYAHTCGLILDKFREVFTYRYKKPIHSLKKKWDYYVNSSHIAKHQSKNKKEKVDAAEAEREQYFKKAKEEGSTWD